MTFGAAVLHRLRDAQKRRVRVTTIDEIDRYFLYVDDCFRESSDAGMAALGKLRLIPKRAFPKNPFSDEYRQAQWELYTEISGREQYHVFACERTPFDLEAAEVRPYPYSTGSGRIVGDQFIGQGFLLQAIGALSGKRIVEFGPGWGNITLALAQTGYDVTGVEVDPNFADLIRRKSARYSSNIKVIEADMIEFESAEQFDIVLFYESFHHCHNHQLMVDRLKNLIRPGGAVIFASEPISIFAQPWGCRLDGQSLWAMRKHGWLELGFDRSYFKELMQRAGWRLEFKRSTIAHITKLWIARRA